MSTIVPTGGQVVDLTYLLTTILSNNIQSYEDIKPELILDSLLNVNIHPTHVKWLKPLFDVDVSLEHLEIWYKSALSEARDILKQDGQIYIVVLSEDGLSLRVTRHLSGGYLHSDEKAPGVAVYLFSNVVDLFNAFGVVFLPLFTFAKYVKVDLVNWKELGHLTDEFALKEGE